MTYAFNENIGQPEFLGSPNSSLSRGFDAPIGGTPGPTKGVWTEVIASTLDDYSYLVVTGQSLIGNRILVDIGIGAIGSEIVIIGDLSTNRQFQTGGGNVSYTLPVCVPKGSRISLRGQRPGDGAQTNAFSVHGISGRASTSIVETYGVDLVNTLGTAIEPGATINTKGAWVEITAATGINLQKLIIRMSAGANSNLSSYNFLFDIAIGSIASEQIIVSDMPFTTESGDDQLSPEIYYMPCDILKGSRISIRAQCSGNDATDRIFYAFLYGLG